MNRVRVRFSRTPVCALQPTQWVVVCSPGRVREPWVRLAKVTMSPRSGRQRLRHPGVGC